MTRVIVAALWFALSAVLAQAGNVNAANFAVGFTRLDAQPITGTRWSSLGVVADSNGTSGSGTDNANALSTLPTGTNIIGDCTPGFGVRIAARWFLQSNLQLYVQPGCIVYCDWPGNLGAGCLTQVDVTVPATNIVVDGLYFKLINPLFIGKAFRAWVDHLTFTNVTVDGFCAFAFARGSDQEWKFSMLNTPCGAGTVALGAPTAGLRHFGNSPKVPTTGGKPANVWVHNSVVIGAGDGAYQVAPACQDGSTWPDVNADDYVYENSYGSNGTAGTVILVGNGADAESGLTCVNTISNVTVRDIHGASANGALKVQNAFDPTGAVSGLTFSNINVDMSPQIAPASQPAIFIRGYELSPISNISISNITIQNNFGLCADLSAAPTSNIVLDTITCPNPRGGAFATIVVRAMTGLTIKNSALGNRTGGAIQLGPGPTGNKLLNRVNNGVFTVVSPTIQNNVITNMSNNDSAILMQNVSGASVTGNSIVKKAGATTAIGINMAAAVDTQPGTTASTVTGNDLTNINVPVVCPPSSQGNTVAGNSGASDCP